MKSATRLFLLSMTTLSLAAMADGLVEAGHPPATSGPPAGFDCTRAATPTEKMICSDPSLAEEDNRLNSIYRSLAAQLPVSARQQLVQDERAWLRNVRNRCGDAACVATAYRSRQAQLQAWPLRGPDAIRQVALGAYHSCVLTAGGAVSCRGKNDSGQLGNGKAGAPVARPVRIIAKGATHIASGGAFTCAVVDGALDCWGNNFHGAIGNGQHGEGTNVTRPTRIITHGVKAVSAGSGHACAIVNDGLQCWGDNSHNQLGRAVQESIVLRPTTIFPKGVSGVSAGHRHTCAIVDDALYCWGYNYDGQIGNGASSKHVPEPALIFAEGVTRVSAGESHTCAIVKDALYCWGKNLDGEIGTGRAGDPVIQPVLVIARGVTAVAVDGSMDGGISPHTCAIVDSALYCWGNNFWGQTGNGPPGRAVPAPVKVLDSGVSAIAVGNHRTCAVVNGAEQCWRYSAYGEINPRLPTAAMGRPAAANTGPERYLGTFRGSLISSGTEFVITRLFLDVHGEMVGEYTTIPYRGSSSDKETGTLDRCQVLPDNILLCAWQDRHGTGQLAMQFDDEATEFRGSWRQGGARAPQVKREYWLGITDWNGVRQ